MLIPSSVGMNIRPACEGGVSGQARAFTERSLHAPCDKSRPIAPRSEPRQAFGPRDYCGVTSTKFCWPSIMNGGTEVPDPPTVLVAIVRAPSETVTVIEPGSDPGSEGFKILKSEPFAGWGSTAVPLDP